MKILNNRRYDIIVNRLSRSFDYRSGMFLLCLFSVILFFSGCSDSDMGYVTGKLTLDGEPAPKGVRITFAPRMQGGSSSTGITNEDGTFEMEFSFSKKGVMVGSSYVTFETTGGGDKSDGPKFKIPAKYREGFVEPIEVKPGKQVIDFNLTSD